jgi:hypothetical protein
LIEKLIEDSGSQQAAGDLLPFIERLAAWQAPQVEKEQTSALVARLEAEMENLATPKGLPAKASPSRQAERLVSWPAWKGRLTWLWQLALVQARLLRGEIWAASALVMALGTLVTLVAYSPDEALPLALVAPIVAAIGVAYIYGTDVTPALEIELATPAPARLILMARLALVFGFNLSLGLAGSAVLAVFRAEISLWALVTAWLAPMTCLSALALLLSVANKDPGVSALFCLGLWGLHIVRQADELSGRLGMIPDLTGATAQPWLWALALLMAAIALWLGGLEEHWVRGKL